MTYRICFQHRIIESHRGIRHSGMSYDEARAKTARLIATWYGQNTHTFWMEKDSDEPPIFV